MLQGLRCVCAGAAFAAAALLVHDDGRADDGGRPSATPASRRGSVVAVVGAAPASRSITAGELEDRIASMPGFQRVSFGPTADAIRVRVLDDVLVHDALLALAADAGRLASEPAVAHAIDRAESAATVRAIRDGLGPVSGVPIADVRAYYERNRARYDAPERYRIWRILCKTRDEAQDVLAAALASGTPKTFAELARDHSQDKATALRSGNLGFLNADGESTEPGLRVDAAVVRAAQGVRDGDLVRTLVAEGEFFSVVWRRGTLAAQKRTVDDAAPAIREILWRQRVKEETDKLVQSLRAAKVHDLHEDLLDAVDLPADAGRQALSP